MNNLIRALTVGALLLGSASLACAANAFTNGSFKEGTTPTLQGWDVNGTVGAIKESRYDEIGGHDYTGNFWAVFGGGQEPGGSIAQTFTTVANQVYQLSFVYGAWGDTTQQVLDISINGISHTLPAQTLTKSWAEIAANTYSYLFTATGESTTLVFTDISGGQPGSFNADGVLTKVSVQAVPGPEAGAGLGALAMGGIALWAKRRRKSEVCSA